MNTTETRPVKIGFPFSLYFEQLFSHNTYVRFINPWSFWRQYKIKHLENCRELNTVQYLERCHHLEWRSWKLTNTQLSASTKISTHNNSPEQQTFKTIFVLQPSIELKYRGVTYRIRKIVTVNISSARIDPQLVKLKNFAQPTNYNNTTTPEIFGGNQEVN